jgi:hypothetical protein
MVEKCQKSIEAIVLEKKLKIWSKFQPIPNLTKLILNETIPCSQRYSKRSKSNETWILPPSDAIAKRYCKITDNEGTDVL